MKWDRVDIRRLGGIKFAVLGSGTADKLWEYGIAADFVPSRYTVGVFAEEFVKKVKEGEKVLIPRAVQRKCHLDRSFGRAPYCIFEPCSI